MDETTNPEAPEVEELEGVEEVEVDSPELDEDGNPVEPEPEDDSEEIEKDGQKFRIPKALKGDFLMQSDYTRKTQALAQEKQALEAERTQFQQLSQAELHAQAQILAIDQSIEQYKQIDWRAWMESDPQAAQAARFDFEDLKDQKNTALNQFGQARQQRTLQEQQATARQLQEGHAELSRQIPGWGQDKANAILDFAQKTYGFTKAQLDTVTDPKAVLALHDAMEYRKSKQSAATVKKVEQQQAVKPAAKVRGATPTFKGLDDRMSADAWAAARNKQLANRNR